MATYLDRIVRRHRELAAADGRPLADLIERAGALPPTRPFTAAIRAVDGLGVISEIKRRSPSKGDLHPGLDPAEMARTYERGGATCLSVLTDVEFFGGSADDLRAAREACALPVLRKDFTVSPRDVVDARLMGADAVLLIVAALTPDEVVEWHGLATSIGLDVLVETHDEAEIEIAVAAGAAMIGVNQRDLVTFQVDHERAVRVAAAIPDGVVKVAESGVRDAADARRLREAGYHAVLVGESVVTATDPAAATQALRTA
ncbi:MAG: indole-3-glycerol phosphate synthase TrpC [Ilumatobacteraceae bacterium]|nr:indole-3-glycerol phosphate synthase TrpC [Ilumatobacteraceae bacterium]